jgi:large subunit ribosomal protein L2
MSNKIISRKPRNPSLRFQTFLSNDDITTKTPEKSLLTGCRKRTGGRNCYGRITTRHIGGGVDRKYRIIDFLRQDRNIKGTIKTVEYDPNRNVRIGLLVFPTGVKRYILLAEGMKVGSEVIAGENVDASLGNCLPIKSIPVGFVVHNIELVPGNGGKIARSAGSSAQIVAKEGEYATLKMPSGEMRMIRLNCWATVGVLGNAAYKNIVIGKAGRNRRVGIRPTVRGIAMNPVDHPRGGGEGRSKSGTQPLSPWGKHSAGARTRRRKSRFIIKRRK